ncbi:MAG: hypothetical protein WCX85_01140 [Bacilli bacterium]
MNKFALFLKTSLLDPLIRSFQRFTDSIVLSILLVIFTIFNLETQGGLAIFGEMLPFLWLSLPLLIFKNLLVERIGLKEFWKYILTVIALIITISFFLIARFWLVTTNLVFSFRMAATWIIAVLLVLLVNYFPKRENFAYYLVFLLTKFFVTLFYAVVLYGGIFAILASIEGLFGFNLSQFIYIDLFFAVIGLVAVPVLVGFLPNHETDMQENDYHKIWKTVFAFIIVPLIMIFSVILIIYIITSFANTNYYGFVYLISALSTAFLTLAMIFLLEKFEANYPHVRFFNKYWPFVLLSILAGFIYELIVALVDEGFTLTTSVYFYIGIALIVLTIVRLFKKPLKLGHGQIIGVTSLFTAIMIAFVPFINILNLATYSANARLEKLLSGADMFVNGEVVPAGPEVSQEMKGRISNAVLSFGDLGYDRIRCLPDDFVLDDFEEVFGFELYNYYANDHIPLTYYANFSIIDFEVMNAGTYTDFVYVPSLLSYDESEGIYTYQYDDEICIWSLSKDAVDYVEIDMGEVIESFYTRLDVTSDFSLDLYTDLKYTPASNDFDVYFVGISGIFNPSEETYYVAEAQFYLGVN